MFHRIACGLVRYMVSRWYIQGVRSEHWSYKTENTVVSATTKCKRAPAKRAFNRKALETKFHFEYCSVRNKRRQINRSMTVRAVIFSNHKPKYCCSTAYRPKQADIPSYLVDLLMMMTNILNDFHTLKLTGWPAIVIVYLRHDSQVFLNKF